MIFARVGRFLDDRAGSGALLSRGFRYVFPDHWTFLFGEIALYCFLILVGTGTYLTFFFEPSTAQVIYDGSYAPLQGQEVSEAYRSAVNISLDVKAGLLIRQTHHWAALVFVAAILVHMLRVFFTGAFRRPRDLNWMVGITLALMALVEGFAGYSLPDDLLSGMGLAIGYSVLAAFPIIGGWLAELVWGGTFPGGEEFISRLYAAHVFILPLVIFGLIGLHLYMVVRHRHTQFAGPGRQERNVIGSPAFPGYIMRSGGLFFATAGVLLLLGGLIQINPIWQYGVYQPWLGHQRRPARLLLRLADRGAAADAQLGVDGQRLHDHPQPLLGRDPLPDDRVLDPVRLAVARTPLQRGPRPAPPGPAAARRAVPHRPGRGPAAAGDDGADRGLRRPHLRRPSGSPTSCRSGSGGSRPW